MRSLHKKVIEHQVVDEDMRWPHNLAQFLEGCPSGETPIELE